MGSFIRVKTVAHILSSLRSKSKNVQDNEKFDHWMDDIENNGILPTELGSHLSPIVGDLYCILFKQAKDLHAKDRPVSTQENKHRIGSDWTFFHLVLSTPPDQKNLKILQLFIIRVADHRFKMEQKIGTKSPCAGSILLRSGPILCFFLEWKSAFTMNKNQAL